MKIPFFSPGNSGILPFSSFSSPRPPGNSSAQGIQFSAAPLAGVLSGERQQRKVRFPSSLPSFSIGKRGGDFLQTNLLSLSVTPLPSPLSTPVTDSQKVALKIPSPPSIVHPTQLGLVAIINTGF